MILRDWKRDDLRREVREVYLDLLLRKSGPRDASERVNHRVLREGIGLEVSDPIHSERYEDAIVARSSVPGLDRESSIFNPDDLILHLRDEIRDGTWVGLRGRGSGALLLVLRAERFLVGLHGELRLFVLPAAVKDRDDVGPGRGVARGTHAERR